MKDQVAESYQRITHRPLLHHFRLAGWAPCLYSVSLEVQDGCSLVYFHPDPLPNEPAGNCSLTANGQHDSAIQSSIWPALLASFPYLDANEETGPQGTDLLAIAIGSDEPDG